VLQQKREGLSDFRARKRGGRCRRLPPKGDTDEGKPEGGQWPSVGRR